MNEGKRSRVFNAGVLVEEFRRRGPILFITQMYIFIRSNGEEDEHN